MINSIAIITARGGSKRIPKKNIKNFCGQPIIKYSIDAALKSGCFSEVMVSTDDQEIANIAESFGAKVPFLRSPQNSNDTATTGDAILEVLNSYKKLNTKFEYFCCIYPTAPFITSEKLSNSLNMLKQTNADAVIPVVKYSYPIQRSLKIENNILKMNWPENYKERSQDLEPAYHDSGQFYWMKTESFLEQKTLFAKKTIPFIINEIEIQDIDTIQDWEIAEFKYKYLKKNLTQKN
ncbi:MAG: pseudaminic acid cytidylyltransferase [bacterium]